MFDPKESLTYEQILRRFEKIFHRKMTPEEKRVFFLSPDYSDPSEKNN